MRKFKFKLERLLMLKEYDEMKAKLNFASELQNKLVLENENRNMKKSILENILKNYISVNAENSYDYNDFAYQEKYINNLMYKIKKNELKADEIEEKLIELRAKLAEATMEKEKINKLKTKEHNKYKKEMKKDESKKIDEFAGQLSARNRT